MVSGALEAGETVLAGTLREVREEIGAEVQVRPLGTMHVCTFRNDENAQYMVGIYFLLAYEGGSVRPGSDMQDSQFRWWGMNELAEECVLLDVPIEEKWILNRAVELFRLSKEQSVILQKEY